MKKLEPLTLDDLTLNKYCRLQGKGYTIQEIYQALLEGSKNEKKSVIKAEFLYWRKAHGFSSAKKR
ncbi:hypothetical protein IGI49_004974 [Enterococcus sp. AZ071]